MWKGLRNALIALTVSMTPAAAQFSGGGGGGGVSADQLAAAVAAAKSDVMSAMPLPAIGPPLTDSVTGDTGSQTSRYMLADSVRPARYRSGSCTIAGGAGQCTISWSTAFAVAPNPLGDPAVLNPGFATSQLTCNWVTLTTTQGTIVCRSSILSLAILGNILSFLGNGVTVYGTAVQPL